jgi:hypothetical protein
MQKQLILRVGIIKARLIHGVLYKVNKGLSRQVFVLKRTLDESNEAFLIFLAILRENPFATQK